MNRLFKTILIISIFLPLASTQAQVDNLVVQFEQTPLFEETNFSPGASVVRGAKVINNSGQPQRIITEAINYPGFISGMPRPHLVPEGDLSRALSIIIREKNGSDLYGGSTDVKTLYDFYQNGEVYLLEITNGAGGFKDYEFEINFPLEKENEWQNATTTFDILIGFQGVEGGVSGGGGGGLPPGLTINYEKPFSISTTTATITWSTSYFSTSQVIYDTVPGKFNLSAGPPNYGYAFSKEGDDSGLEKVTAHSVTLISLLPNTTYYYRAVSHGSLAISQESSFTTLGETPKEELFKEQISSEGVLSGGEMVSIQQEEKEITPKEVRQQLPEVSEIPVIEGPNPLLATLSNFITLGTENNFVAFVFLFLILGIIVLALTQLKKKKCITCV